MSAVLAVILCGDPRAYVGPQQAPSAESQVDPQVDPQEEPPIAARREVIYAPLEGSRRPDEARAPGPGYPFARPPRLPGTPGTEPPREPAVMRPRTGRGLLIAGALLAGTGLAVSSVSLGLSLRPCSGFCEPYGAIFSGLAAPVPWLVGIGMLGGGMQLRSHSIAARGLADGRAVKPPRRGVFGAGLALTIIGADAIVGTWWAPFINVFAQLGGGPLAVAGAMMAGGARGRRLAIREHVTVAPVLTRTTTMLSIRMRW